MVVDKNAHLSSLENVLSVELWVYVNGWSPLAPAVCKSDPNYRTGFGVVAIDEGMAKKAAPSDTPHDALPTVAFFVGGIANKVVVRVPSKEWVHLAGTYDGKTITVYMNGNRADFYPWETAPDECPQALGQDLYVGAHPSKGVGWDGLIDVVRVWKRCVGWDEVRQLMNQAHVRDDPTLLGQWTLSEGAGDSCFDSSGKNCNGRLEGGVTRVQATRDFVPPAMTASERHIDSLYLQLRDFKLKFEKNEGRAMTKGDLHLAPPVISKIAKRLGML